MDFPLIVKHKNIILKLFDWMDYPKDQATRNVEAYDHHGKRLWVIESLGENPATDYYTDISSEDDKIHAFNFQCYDCIIDEETGKILDSYFTK